ncbi:glutamate racemase [Mangrovivirga cuniculi]|uniref:Glutamate racemase n=1 Tax=Mangrovivirga cuniculi TaxID=2715131 RepID=A0A4D7KAG3_9BACT|nr:glutamate racemase [Mangrovivirga cuniculi]QCK16358.1 glutamate racemase [Mangrovivirga cuniculi]
MQAKQPIGIFDSGIGGLTVARAVKELLPNEQIIYFGDTAHLPYGDKSTAAIQSYSVKISQWLLEKNCKVILIACNSASTAAYDLIREYTGKKAKVFDVINPVIDHLREKYRDNKVGLIGTLQTVNSGVYQKKIDDIKANIDFSSLATPLLVPMIEEGFHKKEITEAIISEYLENPVLKDISALILGCTHYPVIKEEIQSLIGESTDVIDSSVITAKALRGYLEYNNLLNEKPEGEDHFYVSDYTSNFEFSTRFFFKKEVHLEKYPLWDD